MHCKPHGMQPGWFWLLSDHNRAKPVLADMSIEYYSGLKRACGVQGGSISVWHDHEGNLKYTLHCYHRLQPGIKSEALGLQSSIVSLVPCLPSFLDSPDQPVSSSRPVTSAPNFMWVLAVMSGGQLWRWRIPLPTPGDSFESLCATGTCTGHF